MTTDQISPCTAPAPFTHVVPKVYGFTFRAAAGGIRLAVLPDATLRLEDDGRISLDHDGQTLTTPGTYIGEHLGVHGAQHTVVVGYWPSGAAIYVDGELVAEHGDVACEALHEQARDTRATSCRDHATVHWPSLPDGATARCRTCGGPPSAAHGRTYNAIITGTNPRRSS